MRLIKYLCRWQLSTPVLWLVIYLIGSGFWQTVLANLIGGLTFYQLDRRIFNGKRGSDSTHAGDAQCSCVYQSAKKRSWKET
jgi:hypothetical protein